VIPDDVVARVREEADIVSIIGEFVKLKRVGTSFRGPCPFHQGKHDNFSVSPRGGYNCFVCGEKGDVFTFIEKRLGLDFVESVKWVGAKAGVEVTEVRRGAEDRDTREPMWEVNATAAAYFSAQLWDAPVGSAAREYLASRALRRGEADRFGMGYAPRDPAAMRAHLATLGFDDDRQIAAGLLLRTEERPEPRPRFRDRVIFPIYDPAGHVVGFGGRALGEAQPKYLNSAESEAFSKRTLLYGLNWAKQAVRRADRLIIVEGYFDAIRLMLAGIQEVVAPLGTALTAGQAALIRKYTKNVFLLYDSDQAGLKATFRAGDALLANTAAVRVITLPQGEDPDTFVAKAGAEGFEHAAAASVDVFDRKIQILERGGWFGDLRRKREALDKLLPTIRLTADPITRDLYVARTAEVAGVSRDMLERELKGPAGGEPRPANEREPVTGRRAERRRDHTGAGVRAERELLRMLLHHRRYVDGIAERVMPEQITDPAYHQIFTALLELGADAPPGDIFERLDDDEATVQLEELLAETGGLDRADEIVDGSVNALLARHIAAELTEIDRLLPLAPAEKKDELIRKKERLAKEMQALGRPRWKNFRSTRS
jgi:DNA primase